MNKSELEQYIQVTPYRTYQKNTKILSDIKKYMEENTDIKEYTIGEATFIIKHKLTKRPRCKCGSAVRYHNGKYQKHCSSACSARNKDTQKKREYTNLNKYGCTNVFQNESIKNKIKDTNFKKYGDINPYRIGSDRFETVMLKKHGVKSAVQMPDTIDKLRRSIWENTYSNFNRFNDVVLPHFDSSQFVGGGYDNIYTWKCVKCNKLFDNWYHNGITPRCTHCTPKSVFQAEIESYLSTFGIPFVTNTKSMLKNKELDIYFPSLKLAIECDGTYWHSESQGKDKTYHVSKSNECAEHNIQLIHIFEDEWVLHKNIVKSRLKSIIGKTKYTIYARKCTVKEITTKTKNKFLEKYHLFGTDSSSVALGCYYNTKLIAVMTFGKRRFDNKDGYELIRYATVSNFRCIGCAGKLLNYFVEQYNVKTVVSYADRRWSVGNLYTALGFTHLKNSPPSYFYMKGDFLRRINRIHFQKHKLKDKLEVFDPNKSERENMILNGYDRIWDCGTMVFEKNY